MRTLERFDRRSNFDIQKKKNKMARLLNLTSHLPTSASGLYRSVSHAFTSTDRSIPERKGIQRLAFNIVVLLLIAAVRAFMPNSLWVVAFLIAMTIVFIVFLRSAIKQSSQWPWWWTTWVDWSFVIGCALVLGHSQISRKHRNELIIVRPIESDGDFM
jgi:hypothetical protein